MADAKSQFTPIDNEKMVERYLRFMEDLSAPVLCAVRETDIRFETSVLRVIDHRVVQLRMKNSLLSPASLREQTEATKAQRIDISFHAQDILIFAATKLTKAHKDGISLEVERPIYKLQRREHLRVKPGKDVESKVTLPYPAERRYEDHAPYDVSAGGFSLLLTQGAAEAFTIGQIFKGISFRFGPHEVLVDASVKNKVPITGPRKVSIKVGFIIESMPPALEREISRDAYLATQKILARRI